MKVEEFIQTIKTTVNQLLSDRQVVYILKCLSQTGLVRSWHKKYYITCCLQIVYFEHGSLSQWVFIESSFLCQDILGYALAPPNYPLFPLRLYQTHVLSEEQIITSLSVCSDRYHSCLTIELLQSFEICHKLKMDGPKYRFPSFNLNKIKEEDWTPGPNYLAYIGRKLTCSNETDFLPPGFLPRLQVQLSSLSGPRETFRIFSNAIICTADSYEYLVRVSEDRSSVDFIGRLVDLKFAGICLHTLDHAQSIMMKLSRQVCPSVFFDMMILSLADLKNHIASPHVYMISEIVDATRRCVGLYNEGSKSTETVESLLYFGDERLMEKNTGRGANVMFLHEDIFEKLELLLASEEGSEEGSDKQQPVSEYYITSFHHTI